MNRFSFYLAASAAVLAISTAGCKKEGADLSQEGKRLGEVYCACLKLEQPASASEKDINKSRLKCRGTIQKDFEKATSRKFPDAKAAMEFSRDFHQALGRCDEALRQRAKQNPKK